MEMDIKILELGKISNHATETTNNKDVQFEAAHKN